MKNNIKKIYLIELFIFVFMIILEYLFFKNYRFEINLINIIFWIAISLFVLMILHFPKDKNYQKSSSNRLIIICLLSALIIIYVLGLFLGYSKNVLSLKPIVLLNNVFPIIVLVTSQEIIRYTIAKNCLIKKQPLIFLTLLYIIFNIIMEINYYNFYDFEQIFKFVCVICLPIIAKELLYSYITYNIGLAPDLLLRISLELYPFVFPFYPSLGEYLIAVIGVMVPYIIYEILNKNIKNQDVNDTYINKIRKRLLLLPIIVVLFCIISLVSGIFNYKLIAIGSNSMVPYFARGDALLYTQYKNQEDYKKIKEGDIIAFKRNNVVITHRVFKILYVNNKLYFKTKGDANKAVDDYLVLPEDILGLVNYKINYIGFPTIWLAESFNKN